jgi:hypothetical protein
MTLGGNNNNLQKNLIGRVRKSPHVAFIQTPPYGGLVPRVPPMPDIPSWQHHTTDTLTHLLEAPMNDTLLSTLSDRDFITELARRLGQSGTGYQLITLPTGRAIIRRGKDFKVAFAFTVSDAFNDTRTP